MSVAADRACKVMPYRAAAETVSEGKRSNHKELTNGKGNSSSDSSLRPTGCLPFRIFDRSYFWAYSEGIWLPTIIKRVWTRALRLYGYHLFLLGIAFTVVTTVAIPNQRRIHANSEVRI
jgi:hypothetical protein